MRRQRSELYNLGRFVRTVLSDPGALIREALGGSDDVAELRRGIEGTREGTQPPTATEQQRARKGKRAKLNDDDNIIDAEYTVVEDNGKGGSNGK